YRPHRNSQRRANVRCFGLRLASGAHRPLYRASPGFPRWPLRAGRSLHRAGLEHASHVVSPPPRLPGQTASKGGEDMSGIRVKDGESIESALKRFKKATEKAGILSEIRKREHYEKPSVKKKKKAIAAKKRAVKKSRKSF